jgi:hypothetical protein
MRRMVRAVTQAGDQAYLYAFGLWSSSNIYNGNTSYANHGSELNYWVQVQNNVLANLPFTHQVQQYFLSFIINSNPNNFTGLQLSYGANTTLPQWPAYNPSADNYQQLGDHSTRDNYTITTTNGVFKRGCDLIDAALPYPPFQPRCSSGYTIHQNNNTCVPIGTGSV